MVAVEVVVVAVVAMVEAVVAACMWRHGGGSGGAG